MRRRGAAASAAALAIGVIGALTACQPADPPTTVPPTLNNVDVAKVSAQQTGKAILGSANSTACSEATSTRVPHQNKLSFVHSCSVAGPSGRVPVAVTVVYDGDTKAAVAHGVIAPATGQPGGSVDCRFVYMGSGQWLLYGACSAPVPA